MQAVGTGVVTGTKAVGTGVVSAAETVGSGMSRGELGERKFRGKKGGGGVHYFLL